MNRILDFVSKMLRGESVTVEKRETTSTSISINRVNGETTFVVNGVTYTSLDAIPEPERQRAREMMEEMDQAE